MISGSKIILVTSIGSDHFKRRRDKNQIPDLHEHNSGSYYRNRNIFFYIPVQVNPEPEFQFRVPVPAKREPEIGF